MSTGAATLGRMDQDLATAATAVEAVLRPSVRDRLRIRYGTQPIAEVIRLAMEQDTHLERTRTWWDACGFEATLTLTSRAGTDEGVASCFIGAALHAAILAGELTTTPHVVDTAHLALAWDRGRRSTTAHQ